MKLSESELLKEVKDRIRNRPRPLTYKIISYETGIPLQFLQDLMVDRLKVPGVTRIEALYNFMSKTKLTFALKQAVFVPQ